MKTGIGMYPDHVIRPATRELDVGTSDDKDKKIVLLESAPHDDYSLSLQNIELKSGYICTNMANLGLYLPTWP